MNKLLFLFIALSLISIGGFCNSFSSQKTNNFISKNDSIKITIPNVFTPNNDGKNDFWSMIVINGLEIFDLHTTVYNRFGKVVFESTNNYSKLERAQFIRRYIM